MVTRLATSTTPATSAARLDTSATRRASTATVPTRASQRTTTPPTAVRPATSARLPVRRPRFSSSRVDGDRWINARSFADARRSRRQRHRRGALQARQLPRPVPARVRAPPVVGVWRAVLLLQWPELAQTARLSDVEVVVGAAPSSFLWRCRNVVCVLLPFTPCSTVIP